MWEANKAIERTRYPSPSLEDLLNILQGSKICCKLDMNNAFWQFKVDSGSREITTFTTHEGLHKILKIKLWNKRVIRNITKENGRNSWKSTELYGYC